MVESVLRPGCCVCYGENENLRKKFRQTRLAKKASFPFIKEGMPPISLLEVSALEAKSPLKYQRSPHLRLRSGAQKRLRQKMMENGEFHSTLIFTPIAPKKWLALSDSISK